MRVDVKRNGLHHPLPNSCWRRVLFATIITRKYHRCQSPSFRDSQSIPHLSSSASFCCTSLLFDISKTNYLKICAPHLRDKYVLFSLVSPGVTTHSPYFPRRIFSNNDVLESRCELRTRLRLWFYHYQTTEPLSTTKRHLLLVLLLYLSDRKNSSLIRIWIASPAMLRTCFYCEQRISLFVFVVVVLLLFGYIILLFCRTLWEEKGGWEEVTRNFNYEACTNWV